MFDDRLCPKWDRGSFGVRFYLDHSSRPRAVLFRGHHSIALALVARMALARAG